MPHSRLTHFLQQHHLLHLATLDEEGLWGASLFYALHLDPLRLIVASDPKTRHAQAAIKNPILFASIALETNQIGLIQGVQLKVQWQEADRKDKALYFKRFPLALAMNPTLWRLDILYAKLTDNRLGFGTKLEWSPPPS